MLNPTKEKIINIRPLVVAAIAVILGVLCAFFSIFLGDVLHFFVAVLVLAVCGTLVLLKISKTKKIIIASVLLIFCFAFSLSAVRISTAKNAKDYLEKGALCGTVESLTKFDKSGYSIVIKHLSMNGNAIGGKARALVYSDREIDAGMRITVSANLTNRAKTLSKNIGEESLSQIGEIFSGVYYNAQVYQAVSDVSDDSGFFESLFIFSRDFLRDNLSENSFPVAAALLLGDTSFLPYQTINTYNMSGLAHVFAVSGLHIGLFVAVFLYIANKLKLKKLTRVLFVLFPAFVYAGVCGFRPSAIRAFIMAATALLAGLIGFKRDRLSVLAAACIIILLWQPFYLFNIGFKLSFMAVGGIIALAPVLKRGLKPLKGLSELVSTTLSATLSTLPLLTKISGYMSIISLFANIIFVPLICLVYQITVCFTLLGMVENIIFGSAAVCMFIPNILLECVNFLVGIVDYSMFIIPASFGHLCLPYYAGLIFLSDYINVRYDKKNYLIAAVLLITVTCAVVFA